MEAWDDGDRVRPIPIEDEDVAFDDRSESPRPDKPGSQRPWLPLVIAVSAVVIVVTSVSVFGALRFDDPEPADPAAFSATTTNEDGSTTTATTLPPRLEETLPGITDRLTLIAERENVAWVLLWDPSFREPKAVSLDVESPPLSRLTRALFDRGGRTVAVEMCTARNCDLYIGTPSDVGATPDIERTLGFIWHASEVGRIAWIEPADDGYRLFTGTANPLSKTVENVEARFDLDEPLRLVQWDAHGFVVGSFIDTIETMAYTYEGEVAWTVPGSASTGTDTIVAVVDSESGWSIIDRRDGLPLDASAPAEELVYVTASDSAELIARLTEREQGYYSLTVSGGDLRAPRIVTIEQRYSPLGFTDDGMYFLFLSDEETVVFVDWNRGSAREISAPDGYRVIGIDVG
jgi:hypothetical protein